MQIDINSTSFSEEDSLELLNFLYGFYHGRPFVSAEAPELVEFLMNWGFIGMARVIYIILGSEELLNKGRKEVKELIEHLPGTQFPRVERKKFERELRYYRERGHDNLYSKFRDGMTSFEVGKQLLKDKDYVSAEGELKEAIEKGIASWDMYHNCGLALYKQGSESGNVSKFEQAIPFYQEAISRNLNDSEPYSCDDLKLSLIHI